MNTVPKFTPSRIAAMIAANVAALNSGRLTFEQFSRVNFATWDLCGTELNIIGSPQARRSAAVAKILAKVQQ